MDPNSLRAHAAALRKELEKDSAAMWKMVEALTTELDAALSPFRKGKQKFWAQNLRLVLNEAVAKFANPRLPDTQEPSSLRQPSPSFQEVLAPTRTPPPTYAAATRPRSPPGSGAGATVLSGKTPAPTQPGPTQEIQKTRPKAQAPDKRIFLRLHPDSKVRDLLEAVKATLLSSKIPDLQFEAPRRWFTLAKECSCATQQGPLFSEQSVEEILRQRPPPTPPPDRPNKLSAEEGEKEDVDMVAAEHVREAGGDRGPPPCMAPAMPPFIPGTRVLTLNGPEVVPGTPARAGTACEADSLLVREVTEAPREELSWADEAAAEKAEEARELNELNNLVVTFPAWSPTGVLTRYGEDGTVYLPEYSEVAEAARRVGGGVKLDLSRLQTTDPPPLFSPRSKKSGLNCNRSGPVCDAILALAHEQKGDVVCLQEPWVGHVEDRVFTKSHPGYCKFLPLGRGTPKAVTNVTKGVRASQHDLDLDTATAVVVRGVRVYSVYRETKDTDTLPVVLAKANGRSKQVVLGDFNAAHRTWQTGRGEDTPGRRLAQWAADRGFDVWVRDVPTHDKSNTLDLVFASSLAGTAVVGEGTLEAGSDHRPVRVEVQNPGHAPAGRWRNTYVPEGSVESFRRAVEESYSPPPQIGTPQELENLVTWLGTAIRATGTNKGSGRSRRAGERRKAFHDVVRKAKREYWAARVDAAVTDGKVFSLAAWSKPRPPEARGPFHYANEKAETDVDKLNLLLQAHVLRTNEAATPAEDVTAPDSTPPHPALDKAPGGDGITARLVKEVWGVVAPWVCAVYTASVRLAHFPRVFKTARVVFFGKPGRRHLSQADSVRPVSIVSALSKGLERIVAKALSCRALATGLVTGQQAGAVPRRSATDLVAALVHDCEVACQKERHGALVTMDIRGGFNAVQHNRMTNRLRFQGWGESLVRWLQSFYTERKAFATGDTGVTDEVDLRRGLPQGSPLSPVLFLLFLTPLLDSGRPAQAGQNAEGDANRCIRWLRDNAVPVAPEKTEFLRLAKGKKLDHPPVQLRDHPRPVKPASAVRYLGVWLDPELKFKVHAQKVAARGQRLANCMKRLNSSLRGLPPAQAIKVARACGVATVIMNSGYLMDILDKPLNALVRAVTPALGTAPFAALRKEAGVLPARVWAKCGRYRASARWKTLDPHNPVVSRYRPPPAGGARRRQPVPTRLQEQAALTPDPPRSVPLLEPSWEADSHPSKEVAAARHRELLRTLPTATSVVDTDGSRPGDAN
ncbi:hypothetical protein DL771_004837 [Monosporascus sp. 5C6A]|nr:hypothetical protein DL771_004837 [Monosporascus sp. 5C6A]